MNQTRTVFDIDEETNAFYLQKAVEYHEWWIWHAFYGMAGANNDINVLDNSPLFDDLLDDLILELNPNSLKNMAISDPTPLIDFLAL
ncbi:ALP1-like protein, partial [Tanacetum coccineum]